MRTSVARFALGLAVLALLLLPIGHSLGETAEKREYLTNFPNFEKLCTAFVAGYVPTSGNKALRQPVLGRFAGDCLADRRPVVLSVTHENTQNSHAGARNYDKDIASYMSDLDLDG